MKILFACGGTAGHINPALSVADALCRRRGDTEVLFAGNPHGMEARLVPKAGYPFAPIEVEGIQRKLTAVNVRRNLHALWLLSRSGGRAAKILREFSPDVVMGTGGYASGPLVRKAHQMGFPTLTHEQNAFPGVTTKLLLPYADRVLIAMEGARERLHTKNPEKIILTGNPVREAVLTADRESARRSLGVGDRVCIVSFGGSLGAQRVNEAIAGVMAWHRGEMGIHHIHSTGSYDYEDFLEALSSSGILPGENPHLDVREYIDNMPTCLAAADLVVCRAGAITLSELECAGRASVLIPSPNVAENHQYHNAMELVRAGAARILEEKDLTPQALIDLIRDMTADPAQLETLGKNAAGLAVRDANDRIIREILSLTEG